MSRFASARHLASWAGQCPGNDQSAGKRRSGKTREGSKWLDFALEEAAMAAIRVKANYPAAQYQRLKPAKTRPQTRPRGGQALTAQRDLAHALDRRDLPRPRRPLLHPTRPRTPDQAPRQTARTSRTPRHARGGSRGSLSELFLSGKGSSGARGRQSAACRRYEHSRFRPGCERVRTVVPDARPGRQASAPSRRVRTTVTAGESGRKPGPRSTVPCRLKRRRADPSPTGTPIRGRASCERTTGRRRRPPRNRAARYRRHPGGATGVLNQQPAPRRTRRDDLIALPSTWVIARIAGRTQ
jgi:hypothetical protein